MVIALLMLVIYPAGTTVHPREAPQVVQQARVVPANVDVSEFARQVKTEGSASVMLDNKTFRLEFSPYSVLTAEARVFLETESGIIEQEPLRDTLFRGYVRGRPGSIAIATVVTNPENSGYAVHLSLGIRTTSEHYSVQTLPETGEIRAMVYPVYGEIREVPHSFLAGGAQASHCPDQEEVIQAGNDYDFYYMWLKSGSVAQSMTYNYVAWASTIYEKPTWDGGVCTELKISGYWIHTWSGEVLNQPPATDPCEGSDCPLLDKFWEHITSSHLQSFNVANLFTGKDPNDLSGSSTCLNGQAAGITSSLSQYRHSFTSMKGCLSGTKGDYASEILTAHEIGHLYGGRHGQAEPIWWDWWCPCYRSTVMHGGLSAVVPLRDRVDYFSSANVDDIRHWTTVLGCYTNGGSGC